MNIVKEYPGMLSLLTRTAHATGFPEFGRNLLANLRFCDRLLREMQGDPEVPEAVRKEVYTTLLSHGPGGILAFSWLVAHRTDGNLPLRSYLDCLPGGPARPDALDEKEALEPARLILGHSSVSSEVLVRSCAHLLSCNALSDLARQTVFRSVVDDMEPVRALELARWASGEPLEEGLPEAPPALSRPGFAARLRLGDPVDRLLERVLSASDPQRSAESGLDLLESNFARIAPERRQRLLEQARTHSEARVRRRAYQLAEATEGENFLRLGLRDLDASVRAWVITRVTQLQAASTR